MSPASPINIDYLLIAYLLRTYVQKSMYYLLMRRFLTMLIILEGRVTVFKLSKVNYNKE